MPATPSAAPEGGPAAVAAPASAQPALPASLYDELSRLQGDQPWGSFLDAGTGPGSLSWLLRQDTERWTAITGAPSMKAAVDRVAHGRLRSQDRIVLGNWVDPTLLQGERYDTVMADYLLGAIEGFAPYWQDQLFSRLRPLVGKRLYVIGLEPYVSQVPDDPDGALVCAIGRLRDTCLLLAGERPYREYPLEWVLRQLRAAGFQPLDVQRHAIRYGTRFINGQLDMCIQRLSRLADRRLALALTEHVSELRTRALAYAETQRGLVHGHDYVVMAVPAN